ncbi:endonuclease III [Bdellovibrio sp. NC01]|uniref:endonuclease III n=1 Tax=Bdellovibrio sp. NC01 TaxID=2220073 RepID=UPI00115989CF|nr:endonuclease III [Bdellovibrio sp. NC01]QDK36629.1 endonuclease III [Bdellovibrio sp. NC01]
MATSKKTKKKVKVVKKAAPKSAKAATAPAKKALKKPPFKKAAPILPTIALLKRYYPDAHCALDFTNPWELLVATSLSAQCTDERVNMTTPALFKRCPTPQALLKTPVEDIEKMIHSCGFYKNKAKNLKAAAETLVEKYNGEVPKDLEALVELGGVGRKTANVVLGNAFGIPSGIVVDTHVTRLSNRLGWVDTENAVQIERELSEEVPQEDWIMLSHWLISHGRAICKARKPDCSHCFLEETCPKRGV